MRCIGSRVSAVSPGALLCVACVRNEALRLPYFLEHYRRLGVDHFLIVDNASEDGTTDILQDASDVSVFFTEEPYSQSRCGLDWLNELLDTYAVGHWTLTVDADELFAYPLCETLALRELAAYLDRRHEQAVLTFLLDMYGSKPVRETVYLPGQSFLEACPYFDRDSYIWPTGHDVYGRVPARGGPRGRRFWSGYEHNRPAPFLAKIPFVRWRAGFAYAASTHQLPGVPTAEVTGTLLHFKFFADFVERVALEAVRAEHFEEAAQYRCYNEVLRNEPALGLLYPGSVRYDTSRQLVEMGLICMPRDYPSDAGVSPVR
jgi:glycosyltransferase involved in cell wall biosynthesis